MSEKRLRVLVVDDEAPARDELAFLLRQQQLVASVEMAADATECLDLIDRGGFDAVFCDVRMPHMDGLALARVLGRMGRPPQVVFVTAYEDHAVEAFGLAAVDYLMKPVRPERLGVTIARLVRAGGPPTREVGLGASIGDRIAVHAHGRIQLIPVAEVRVASVDGEGTTVLTPEGRYHVRQPLHQLEEQLGPRGFLRVHRRYLVNLNHVSSIESFFNGTYLLKLDGLRDVTVPVSRRHAPDLKVAVRL